MKPLTPAALFILQNSSFILLHGDVAQLGERRLCKADVRGSSPLISTWAGVCGSREGH